MSLHEIEIEYGKRYTDFVMGMYVETSMADDINMIGWNLCDCDDDVYHEKIGNCKIKSFSISNNTLLLSIELMGLDDNLKDAIVEEFLDIWGGFIFCTKTGLLSRV